MLNFDFLDKGLGIVSPAHFVYDFSVSCYILLTDQISVNRLLLLLEKLGNMCIAIVYYQDYDVMPFEINLIFLIEPFFLHDQKFMTKTYIS